MEFHKFSNADINNTPSYFDNNPSVQHIQTNSNTNIHRLVIFSAKSSRYVFPLYRVGFYNGVESIRSDNVSLTKALRCIILSAIKTHLIGRFQVGAKGLSDTFSCRCKTYPVFVFETNYSTGLLIFEPNFST